jgi:succinate dehydrogenase / fumarate reductase cytochrome b subunit
MSWFKTYTKSSIGKKQVMAVTGLAWAGFAVTHLLGNIPLAFGAKEIFNAYAKGLSDLGPLLYIAELGLIVILVLHMFLAFKTRMENKAARPIAYAVSARKGVKGIASFTMPYTGMAIFFFLILHIVTFKYGSYYCVGIESAMDPKACSDGVARDLYRTVAEEFSKFWYSAIYIVAMLTFGLHVSHGVGSALQTFGLNHPRYNSLVTKLSTGYGVFIAGGNILIVIAVMVRGV